MDNKDIFEFVIGPLRNCAEERGYTVAIHGSLSRDIDLIAIPWESKCCKADELVDSFGNIMAEKFGEISIIPCNHQKPHGRRAWAIFFGKETYIDLSVMPLA
jgi:hypothetical protein